MRPDRQRGFALVSGIFILVVLAALGGFIVTISTTQHVGVAQDIDGARAYQAARAGIEWGVYKVVTGDTATIDFRTACRAAAYAAPTSYDLGGLAGTAAGFGLTVTCGSGGTAYSDGGPSNVWVYEIQATACSPATGAAPACPNTTPETVGASGYIERRIRITVTD